ncbi:MAG: DUF211 domain-containing protein [Candidatus Altiarchaeota archaeon]
MAAVLRKVVLDVLKPHEPDIVVLSKDLASKRGVDGVNISVYEMDKKVENVKVTIEGTNIDMNRIREYIHSIGGSLHSIDEVVAGQKIVDEEETLQERHQDQCQR